MPKRLSIISMLALLISGAPFSVSAQDMTKSPVYQDKLVDLADVLGRIHSIRVLCNGQSDQYWRQFMRNLLDVEAPQQGYLRSRMVESFNTAYTAEQALRQSCTIEATQAETELSERGRALSDSLASMASGVSP